MHNCTINYTCGCVWILILDRCTVFAVHQSARHDSPFISVLLSFFLCRFGRVSTSTRRILSPPGYVNTIVSPMKCPTSKCSSKCSSKWKLDTRSASEYNFKQLLSHGRVKRSQELNLSPEIICDRFTNPITSNKTFFSPSNGGENYPPDVNCILILEGTCLVPALILTVSSHPSFFPLNRPVRCSPISQSHCTTPNSTT